MYGGFVLAAAAPGSSPDLGLFVVHLCLILFPVMSSKCYINKGIKAKKIYTRTLPPSEILKQH